MRILIDIGHPAHVHYFKNFIKIMGKKNHSFFISARDREHIFELLKSEDIDFYNRGKGSKSIFGKLFNIPLIDYKIFRKAKVFNPDLFIGFASPYISHVAWLMGKPSIIFDDTDHARLNHLLYSKFASHILTPTTFSRNFKDKHIKFNSYMELCALHPKYFSPSEEILSYMNLNGYLKYVIIRFVSWNANHDLGIKGIDFQVKGALIKELSKYVKVFIISESDLHPELKELELKLPDHRIHHAMYYASLVFGESATMASEAAVLGTPAVYLDKFGRGYTDEEEKKYGLVYNFTLSYNDQLFAIKKAMEILKNDKTVYLESRQKMLSEKIDVTAFMVWFIENYPNSAKIMKENPDYQYNFK